MLVDFVVSNEITLRRNFLPIRSLPSADDVFGNERVAFANRLAARSPYLRQLETGVAAGLAKPNGLDSHSLERRR